MQWTTARVARKPGRRQAMPSPQSTCPAMNGRACCLGKVFVSGFNTLFNALKGGVLNPSRTIKDSILNTVGDTCEKIILFGSHAYGTPREGSDYDFFVVLRDGTEKPVLILQRIYRALAESPMPVSVDVLANYRSRFEWRSAQPTIERRIANDGLVLYERRYTPLS